jgi:soluble lytic murein transglycosylase-like protein
MFCFGVAQAQAVPEPADPNTLFAAALVAEHGEGVPKDFLKAAELYCEAARLGHTQAQFNLGWMYANGRGVPRNDAIAAQLFGMASRAGSEQALNMLRVVGAPAAGLLECLREKLPPAPTVEVLLQDDRALLLAGALPNQREIIELVFRLAPEYQVNPKLALAVISAESAFNINARSPKNALGLMQLIPETAARFNVKNAFDPVQNIRGGLAYLRWLLAYFRGDVALVAAGYNAGEGAVDKYRGIPPYRETQGYVKSILGVFKSREHPYDSSISGSSPVLHLRGSSMQRSAASH